MPDLSLLRSLVAQAQPALDAFAQRLVQTPSLSGQEEAVARLVHAEMRALGYDEVWVDAVGNVWGKIAGGDGGLVLFNSHMDVVDPGDSACWRRPPYGGEIADGFLWGRGASDTKGCLAAQVYALGLLRRAGLRPAGDVYLAAVVWEEGGGLGTAHLLETFRPAVAVIGEPSGNTLRRGHRGRTEFVLNFRGRSAHASAPERGLNPHYSVARFLLALRQVSLRPDPTFGGSSVAPTLIYAEPNSSNVIPERVTVHLDWRSIPGETRQNAEDLLADLLRQTVEPGVQASITVRRRDVRTYTGLERSLEFTMPGYCLAAEDPVVLHARDLLQEALGRPVAVDVWTFSTDGGQIAAAGTPCLGFGPGEEALAHVVDERLSLAQLHEATVGYMALALGLGQGPA